MLSNKNILLKFISYEGVFFGYFLLYFCNKRKRFFSNKYITFWCVTTCLWNLYQNSFVLTSMIISYINTYKSDLLVMFVITAQDCLFQLQTFVSNCIILFYRKRALKWLNFGLELSKILTLKDWKRISKCVGSQILFRYITATLVCILYYIDFEDAITVNLLLVSLISFNTNLVAVTIYRILYFIVITILKRATKDITFQRDLDKIAPFLMDIQKSVDYLNKYLSKPILIVFGLIFLGGICNVSRLKAYRRVFFKLTVQ